jgi:hypothetical protein
LFIVGFNLGHVLMLTNLNPLGFAKRIFRNDVVNVMTYPSVTVVAVMGVK